MSTSDGYPILNPFPILGTFTIAGGRQDLTNDAVSRWLPRVPITRLGDELKSYRREFRAGWTGTGRAVFLRGPHGSGKTHTVYAALKEHGSEDSVFSIYCLQQTDDLFDCYRQVVARLNKEPGLWKKLGDTLLATMAGEQWSRELGDGKNIENLTDSLRSDPSKAQALFESYTVGRSATVSRQEKALLDLTQSSFNKSLRSAVDALQSGKYEEVATRWLSLETVRAEELASIGIAGPIQIADEAVATILLLAALSSNAGNKPVLVIDQVEKLLPKAERLVTGRNEGYLRTLIEGFRVRNGLLLLAGSEDGWDNLPADIRGRLEHRVIDCPLLNPKEAADLVRLYLTPADVPFTRGTGGIFPFTEGALKEMLLLSAGSPRKLMQFCHETFRRAQPTRGVIDETSVRALAKDQPQQYYDRETVIAETRRILSFQPLRFQENSQFGSVKFDFVIQYADQAPAMLIQVSDAIFQDDEAANAIAAAQTRSWLRDQGVQIPFVLIVTGYVSPDVVEHLSKITQKLIIFSPETYEGELRKVAADVGKRTQVTTVFGANRELEEKVEQLLLQLGQERASQAAVIAARGADLAESQGWDRYLDRLERTRVDWAAHRKELVDKIQQARKSRREDRLKLVNDEIRRSRSFWQIRDGVSIVLAVMLLVYGFQLFREADVHSMQSYSAEILTEKNLYIARMLLWAALIPFGLALVDLLLALTEKRAWSLISSPRDLVEVGRNYYARVFGSRVHAGNPVFRLAAYRGEKSNRIPAERLGLIREAALKNNRRIENSWWEFVPLRKWDFPEVLLAFEDENKWPPIESFAGDLRPAVDVLLAMKGGRPHSFPARVASESTEQQGEIGHIFNIGLDRVRPQEIPLISERDLRDAVRIFSPFEEGGIGTFDFLRAVKTIDELFLFCSQYLFYSERGSLKNNHEAAG